MKKGRRGAGRLAAAPLTAAEVTANFTRGMVVSGLLTAFQERWTPGEAPVPGRKVLRYALQGGTALAAATAAADALRGRNYAAAMLALAAGTAGVVAIERLLNPADNPAQSPEPEENGLG